MRLSSTAASGANAQRVLELERGGLADDRRVAASTRADQRARGACPTLPATATGSPASRWMCPISSTVVVLPFVPVTAMNSFASIRQASSSSPSTGMPARARGDDHGRLRRDARALDRRARTRSSSATPSSPRCSSTPAAAQRSHAGGRARVHADHLLPARAQRERSGRRPSGRARRPGRGPPGSGGDRGAHRSADALAVDREADRAADRGDDPEAQDDLRLRPRPAARNGGGSAPSGTRVCASSGRRSPGSATDSASITKIPPSRISSTSVFVITASPAIAPPSPSEPVSPMKIVAGKALNHRKPMHPPTRQPASIARSYSPVMNVIADVGEQHDRRAARREAVEPVGEVDRAGRAGHDEVDQQRVEGRRDRSGSRRSAAAACCARCASCVATYHSPSEIAIVTIELRPRPQPERAALDELGVVVGEAEQRARDRRAEDADRAPFVVGEDQERDRRPPGR